MAYLLTCGPFALTVAAWVKLFLAWRRQRHPAMALAALCMVTAAAVFSAVTFLYYRWKPPSPTLPPWQDPEILNFSLLFLLAPIAMIFGVIATKRDAPKWLIVIVILASIPLFFVGLLAGMAV